MIKYLYFMCGVIMFAVSGCEPETLTWDLSSNQDISQVGWPNGRTDIFYSRHGIIDFTIRLPHGKSVSETVSVIECERSRENNRITMIRFKGLPTTKEEAYVRAKEFANYFDFTKNDMKMVDDWYHGVTKPPLNDDRLEVNENSLYPTVSVDTMHTYDNEKPWVVSLEFCW
jgi:hypothetical protein